MPLAIRRRVTFRTGFRFLLRRHAAGLAARFAAMLRAVEGRRALARMDDRMLSDIGISRAEALAEAQRKPWDIKPEAGK